MTVTVADVRRAAGLYYGLTSDELRGPTRLRRVARPRQIAMALCRAMTSRSLIDIGSKFGRDHTTVLHAIAWTETRAAECPKTDAEIDAVALLAVRCAIDRKSREHRLVKTALERGEIIARAEDAA